MRLGIIILSLGLFVFPSPAWAFPAGGEIYRYWSEPELQASVALGDGKYEITGRYVAVLTYEEKPPAGHYAMIGELFDCAEMQYALAEEVEYDENNREIASYSNDKVPRSFKPIDEDTRQEFLLIGICSEETGQPYDVTAVRRYFQMIADSLQATDRILNR